MKFETITVSSRGKGIDAALAQAEFVAKELGLRGHDALHMRLLVEEMMNMVRSIIGDLEGKFWIETDGSAYRLYLQSKTLLDATPSSARSCSPRPPAKRTRRIAASWASSVRSLRSCPLKITPRF